MARRKPVDGSKTRPSTGESDDRLRDGSLPADIADDADVDPESAARTICLRLLTARSRTRSELETALAKRNVPAAAATAVLDRLTDVGLINDTAFAEQFVAVRKSERGLSARELRRQLSTKGVADEVAAAATSAIDSDSERRTAQQLVDRKLRSMSGLEPQVKARRLVGLLARKGYSPGLSYAVVREALDSAAAAMGEADDTVHDFA